MRKPLRHMGVRQALVLTGVCLLLHAVSMGQQFRIGNTISFGVCGTSRTTTGKLVVGLPFPVLRIVEVNARAGERAVRGQVINVSTDLGSSIEWKMYDLSGRCVLSGRAEFSEYGPRELRISEQPGVYVLVLMSSQHLGRIQRSTILII